MVSSSKMASTQMVILILREFFDILGRPAGDFHAEAQTSLRQHRRAARRAAEEERQRLHREWTAGIPQTDYGAVCDAIRKSKKPGGPSIVPRPWGVGRLGSAMRSGTKKEGGFTEIKVRPAAVGLHAPFQGPSCRWGPCVCRDMPCVSPPYCCLQGPPNRANERAAL